MACWVALRQKCEKNKNLSKGYTFQHEITMLKNCSLGYTLMDTWGWDLPWPCAVTHPLLGIACLDCLGRVDKIKNQPI